MERPTSHSAAEGFRSPLDEQKEEAFLNVLLYGKDSSRFLSEEERNDALEANAALHHKVARQTPSDTYVREKRLAEATYKLVGKKEAREEENKKKANRMAVLRQPNGKKQTRVIALATAGGGMRAMLAQVGFLQGCKDTGILDQTTYVAGLSGSSWALGVYYSSVDENPFIDHHAHDPWSHPRDPWSATVNPDESNSPMDFRKLNEMMSSSYSDDDTNALLVEIRKLLDRWRHRQGRVRLADLWGLFLGWRVLRHLKEERFTTTFASCAEKGGNFNFPIPITTAKCLFPPDDRTTHWVEYTPWEVAIEKLGIHVPTAAFGQQFPTPNKGEITTYLGDESLYYHLGVWGSFYHLSYELMLEYFPKDWRLSRVLKVLFKYFGWETKHTNLASRVYNPAYGFGQEEYHKAEYMQLSDAGTVSNIPLPPFLGDRKVDTVIVFDTSDKVGNDIMGELNKLRTTYHIGNPPPAKLGENNSGHEYVYVIEKTEQSPQIIYLPFMKVRGSDFDPAVTCPTTKLMYTEGEISATVNHARSMILGAKKIINDLLSCT